MSSHIQYSNGKEYRISDNRRWVQTRHQSNGQPNWLDTYSTPGSLTISDLREASGQNIEVKLSDGRWYETTSTSMRLTREERENEAKAKKASRKDSKTGKENSGSRNSSDETADSSGSLSSWFSEYDARLEAERRQEEEEDERWEALKEKIFGADFHKQPYETRAKKIIGAIKNGAAPSDRLCEELRDLVRYRESYTTSPREWTDQLIENINKKPVQLWVAEFMDNFPDFYTKFHESAELKGLLWNSRRSDDRIKAGMFDLFASLKNSNIEKWKKLYTDAVRSLESNINELEDNLIRSEADIREYLIKVERLKEWEANGTGSELTFFGSEKSDSPLSRLRESVNELNKEKLIDHLKKAGEAFKTIKEQLKEVTKLAKKLHELTGNECYAAVAAIKDVNPTGMDIAGFLHSKGIKGTHKTGMFSFQSFSSFESVLDEIPLPELKALFQIP